MKKIICFVMMLPTLAIAQVEDIQFNRDQIPVSNETLQISYSFVDSIPAVSKDRLYSKALEWVALNFKDANAVFKLQDKDAGKIVAKGMSLLTYTYRFLGSDIPATYSQYFTIDFSFKDNKYRVIMTDFVYKTEASGSGYSYKAAYEEPMEKTLSLIPVRYDFESMTRNQKIQIISNKQIINNTLISSTATFQSIKSAMRKAASTSEW